MEVQMAKKATVHSFQFAVKFDSNGLTLRAPADSEVKLESIGSGRYRIFALPPEYEIATGARPSAKKKAASKKSRKK
jgi:hypothetical protein